MAPHSSTLAWKIPWKEEPGRLQSMGLLGVGHDWATSLSLFTLMHWRRKWQPTPVFLPGESQGRGSLVSCHLWGRTESDPTEATWQQQQQQHIYVCPLCLCLYLCLVTKIIYANFFQIPHICINIQYLIFWFASLCVWTALLFFLFSKYNQLFNFPLLAVSREQF